MRPTVVLTLLAVAAIPAAAAAQQKAAPTTAAARIADAMVAGPTSVTAHATIMDWPASPNGKPMVLRAGTNGWVCYPRMPGQPLDNPMCLDGAWQKLIGAMMAHKAPPPGAFGLSYMLGPADASSNTDPYANKATATNEWGTDGPHLMLIVPAEALKGVATKRSKSGAYVMWRGTPYAHIMVPIAGT